MFNKQWDGGTPTLEMSKQWDGSMRSVDFSDDDRSNQSFSELGRRADEPPSRRLLDETQQSWLLEPNSEKKQPMVDFGFMSCSRRYFRWSIGIFCACVFITGLSLVIWRFAPKKHHSPPTPDNYTVVLSKALTFFDIQKSGDLSSGKNRISWRGSSALLDGRGVKDGNAAVNLTGGFYDAGDNVKFAFTGAYAMTLLSWSVIEYTPKFLAVGELDHAKELIKWGSDYLLKTFNSSALDRIYCQVGTGGGKIPNDHYCWERPEDLDHFSDTRRSTIAVASGSDLAGEMAAALAAASIVFKDQAQYASELLKGAKALYDFAKRSPSLYLNNSGIPPSERALYNSTSFSDELIWGSTWLFFATGNLTYLGDATIRASNWRDANAFGAFDWDSKLVGAQMLLTRLRMLQGPGYPYEQLLSQYHDEIGLVMCAYLPYFQTFNRTKGGLLIFNPNATQHLAAVANAAFLATLYADYLKAADVPVVECGPNWFSPDVLRNFSRTQVDYILGKNPIQMSYVVGHGDKFPLQPHHRAASFPKDGKRYSCEEGWKWRDRDFPNPHVLEGAMVGGPNMLDLFNDTRSNSMQNEPTLAANAGLVGALVALSEASDETIDPNSLFTAFSSFVQSPPPPAVPWTP